jgi:hypothetical protein
VLDLDLNDRTLLTFGLEGSLDQLAGYEDPHALLEAAARVLGAAPSCRAAEEPRP